MRQDRSLPGEEVTMKYPLLIAALFLSITSAKAAGVSVDSVSVDAVWNTDSNWYDINGVPQLRTSRDFNISFFPRGYGVAACSISVSIDSGKTWGPSPNPLIILDQPALRTVACGRRSAFHCRLLGGDRPNVVFKVIANICDNISCGLYDLVFSLPGWAPANQSDVRFFGDTMWMFVNGGDWIYMQDSILVNNRRVSTLKAGFCQHLVRPSLLDSNDAESFVLDYRATPYAMQAYNRFKAHYSQYSGIVPIGGLDTSVAFGRLPTDNFLEAWAHFAQFVVQIRVGARGSNPLFTRDSLVRVAELYFNMFKSPDCPPPPSGSREKISITTPLCGQKCLVGDTVRVSWSQTVPSAKLTYRFNSTDAWQPFTGVIPGNANEARVVLPASFYSDSTFQIQVEDNSGAYDPGTLDHVGVKYLVLTYPDATSGGTYFNIGNSVTVYWRSASSKISSLRVMLSTDGGKSYYDMLTSSIEPTVLATTWIVGSEPGHDFTYPAKLCRIKISDYNDGRINDISALFSVYK
jgi:hypothetical protein